MKFPEGGGLFFREVFGWGNGLSRTARLRLEGAGQTRAFAVKLFTQLKLLGDRLVTTFRSVGEVIQQPAALADHQQQATA